MILLVTLASHATPIMLVLYALVFGVLIWGTYEALRAIIEGRWRLTTIMRSFWAGVATTIVCGVFMLFALWLVTSPKVVECIKDNDKPAVSMDIVATRRFGYLRTYEVGPCTAYFVANNSAKYFR